MRNSYELCFFKSIVKLEPLLLGLSFLFPLLQCLKFCLLKKKFDGGSH